MINGKKLTLQTSTQIVLIIIITILAIYPLWENYKFNDYSKNWLNHDYGKNLLSSTEEYSIFMTEGGDNQVFSTLYFTYAERLRQDLFPYDQKGNIFKRIYGDMRYITVDILEERASIVNKGLFNGEEPFYMDMRSWDKPYLVPYALGKPHTYLTWKLNNPQCFGDFYYKNYGQMFKVQHIKYAIIDYIEITTTETIERIHKHLETMLNRKISDEALQNWLNELIKEQLISVNNKTITFFKTYKKPFRKNPKDTFLIRWQNIPNLEYFDFFSRENVIGYAYEQINFLALYISEQQLLYHAEDSAKTKSEIYESMKTSWNQISDYTEMIKKIGFDSSATLHNVGIFYLNAHKKFDIVTEDLTDISLDLWEQAIENAPYAWSTYNVLIWGYLKQALLKPENSETLLEEMDIVVTKMTNNMKHWKSMRKNITQAKPYRAIADLINFRHQFHHISGEQFIKEKYIALDLINKPAEQINFEEIYPYVQKMIQQISLINETKTFYEFIKFWHTLWEKKKEDPSFFSWHIQTLGELAQYSEFIDISLYKKTARDSLLILKSSGTKEELSIVGNLIKISHAAEDKKIAEIYKKKFLKEGKNILSSKEFEEISRQLEQM